jgi:hypothetical protein
MIGEGEEQCQRMREKERWESEGMRNEYKHGTMVEG